MNSEFSSATNYSLVGMVSDYFHTFIPQKWSFTGLIYLILIYEPVAYSGLHVSKNSLPVYKLGLHSIVIIWEF